MHMPQDFVFEQRRPLHYSYRLACHLSLLARGLRRPGHRVRWLALAAASISTDLLVGRALVGHRTRFFGVRLALDTLDSAVWVHVGETDASTTRATLLIAVPHAVEAGYGIALSDEWTFRSLTRALAIPVVTTGAVVMTRRKQGHGAGATQVLWGVLGIAMGMSLGRHERLERRRAVAAGAEIVADKTRLARFQGQAEIALGGAGGVPHDLKKDLLVLAESGSALAEGAAQELMDRKMDLIEVTAGFGAYLGHVLTGISWLPEDAWSVRLTGGQAERLHTVVAQTGRPARLELLNEQEARRPGGRVLLRLDDRTVDLAGEAPPRHWLADPAPLGFLLSAAWRVFAMIPNVGPTPWPIATVGAGAELVGMLAYRWAPVPSDPSAPVQASLISALAFATAATRMARTLENREGEQIFPASSSLHGYSMVAARYWDELPTAQRRWAVAGGLVVGAIAFFGPPRRTDWWAVAGELPFELVPCFGLHGFDRRKKAQAHALAAEMESTIEEHVDQARKEGRASELDRTIAYVERIQAALDELGDAVPPSDAVAIRARCREARRWLDQARA